MPQGALEVFCRRDTVGVEEDFKVPSTQGVKQLQCTVPGFVAAIAKEDPPLTREQASAFQQSGRNTMGPRLSVVQAIKRPELLGQFAVHSGDR